MSAIRFFRNAIPYVMVTLLVTTLLINTPYLVAQSTSEDNYTQIADLAYGPEDPGNLLDLYLPNDAGEDALPLIIWHSGSAWFSNMAKDDDGAVAIAEEFTSRGFAVATLSIRSSIDARFPAQGHDVRAAIRFLRENAAEYGINPDQFAMMGNSSGGWATAFAATTSNIMELPGEEGVNGISSAVQVAVPFFPPTDFLSMDTFAAENDLPMGFAYPHDSPTSPEGLLIECGDEPAPVPPSEEPPEGLLSIQDCPEETEAADPTSYIDGEEIPIWVLHGGADELLPFNQSQLVYEATMTEGNVARYTFVPTGEHDVGTIIDAEAATTRTASDGEETVAEGAGPSWDEIEEFIRSNLTTMTE